MQEPYNALVKFVKAYNVLEEEDSEKYTHMKVDCLMCLSLVYFILDDHKNTKKFEKHRFTLFYHLEFTFMEDVSEC